MSPLIPGAYEPIHEHDIEEPGYGVPGLVAPPSGIGREVAGPPLSELEAMFGRVIAGLHQLAMQAKVDARERIEVVTVAANTDANGDCVIPVFTAPAGATAHCTMATFDEAGVDPGNPDTNANLFMGIYHASGPGITNAVALSAAGQLLDASPLVPTINAQIPYVFTYADWRACPSIRSGECFYARVDGATASRQIVVTFTILVRQPND